MSESELMNVEVAYALEDKQEIHVVEVPVGCTLEQAVQASGILDQFPDIDQGKNKMGIFGKLSKAVTVLNPGDRVEIYRPLIADPKEVRRKREADGKRMKKGGSDS